MLELAQLVRPAAVYPNMYGPKFNSTTTAVYNAANGATANDIVGD